MYNKIRNIVDQLGELALGEMLLKEPHIPVVKIKT